MFTQVAVYTLSGMLAVSSMGCGVLGRGLAKKFLWDPTVIDNNPKISISELNIDYSSTDSRPRFVFATNDITDVNRNGKIDPDTELFGREQTKSHIVHRYSDKTTIIVNLPKELQKQGSETTVILEYPRFPQNEIRYLRHQLKSLDGNANALALKLDNLGIGDYRISVGLEFDHLEIKGDKSQQKD